MPQIDVAGGTPEHNLDDVSAYEFLVQAVIVTFRIDQNFLCNNTDIHFMQTGAELSFISCSCRFPRQFDIHSTLCF